MDFPPKSDEVAVAHLHSRCLAAGLASLLLAGPAAAEVAASITNMADMSIEELANIQITSVSKKPERLANAAASIFVITADDIRRSGAASLPDALRLAPNLNVAQQSAYNYAITARGMTGVGNSQPNKLLVLIDGRSAYSPLFSGVFWDVQDMVLEDIERIEVISGPGGTLWGVNAVNGVINIITRSATETAGSLVAAGFGERGANLAFRQGASVAGGGWRVYGKYNDLRHTELASGGRVNDSRHQAQLGFRGDWESGGERFSVHGNAYRAGAEQPLPGAVQATISVPLGAVSTSGANLTGSWTHALADGASLSLQAYLDRSKRNVRPTFNETLEIADLQFQHTLPALGAHSLVWGANYRYTWDDVKGSVVVAFLPERLNQKWSSLFVQDEITLQRELRLTAGVRVERNPYTGTELLPTLRLSWKAAPTHALWAGISRTVRAPARQDVDVVVPGRPPYLLIGGPRVRSEVARVFELGYRGQPLPGLSTSATLFHNRYDYLRTQTVNFGPPVTVEFDSRMEGKSTGIEMWGNYQATPNWRLSAGLTALHQRFTLKPGSRDVTAPANSRKDPSHTAQLRSTFMLADDKELEVAVRKVAALGSPEVPGYTAVDARFGWRIRKNVELSLAGHNLNGGHGEYGRVATRTEVPRAVSVRLLWDM
jgi:iron complex outermembrane receptor protein